ncbi:MAG: hypothetical protein EPN43_01395 [Jatrophihabitans sp.]|nr:MAG: hypothetical protein EPN43_01395 [Jatrophihabitans sp.]
MRAIRAFGRFWYEFLIGDDWKIAAAVVSAMVVLGVIMASTRLADSALAVLGGALVVVLFAASLVWDTRRRR